MAKLIAEWIPKDKYLPPHETFILAYIDMGAKEYNRRLIIKDIHTCSIDPNGRYYCINDERNKCAVFMSFYWIGKFDQFKPVYEITKETPILINNFNISCHIKSLIGKVKDKYPTIDELNNLLSNPFDSWNMSNLACWQSL